MKDKLMFVWHFLAGKKSYIVGIMLILVGLIDSDIERVLEGLGLMALRNGLTTEAAKMLLKK